MGHKISHDKPHQRPSGLNPRVRGPFLDDIRKEQERAYREARTKALTPKEEPEEEELDNTIQFPVPEQEEEENADGE